VETTTLATNIGANPQDPMTILTNLSKLQLEQHQPLVSPLEQLILTDFPHPAHARERPLTVQTTAMHTETAIERRELAIVIQDFHNLNANQTETPPTPVLT